MKKQNDILIIGAGLIGSKRARVCKKNSPGSRIFIFDKDHSKAESLAKEVNGISVNSLERTLKEKNIKIVIIAVINKFLKNYCIKAIKNKKHVLCEKPMGMNYREALEIQNAVKECKTKFKCGFNHRYHPALLEAHKLCKKNTIGEILYIRAIYGHGGRKNYDKEWRSKKSLCGGGELLDQGCHLIDLCNWFFDFEKIKKAHCVSKTMFWDMEVDDNAFAIFETINDKVAIIHASWTQWKNLFRFEIFGTKGSIEINGLGKSYGTETLTINKRIVLGKAPQIITKEFKGEDVSWEKEWKDFIKSINTNKKVMSDEDESTKVMKCIQMLYNQ